MMPLSNQQLWQRIGLGEAGHEEFFNCNPCWFVNLPFKFSL